MAQVRATIYQDDKDDNWDRDIFGHGPDPDPLPNPTGEGWVEWLGSLWRTGAALTYLSEGDHGRRSSAHPGCRGECHGNGFCAQRSDTEESSPGQRTGHLHQPDREGPPQAAPAGNRVYPSQQINKLLNNVLLQLLNGHQQVAHPPESCSASQHTSVNPLAPPQGTARQLVGRCQLPDGDLLPSPVFWHTLFAYSMS